jgi:hypothetical protein
MNTRHCFIPRFILPAIALAAFVGSVQAQSIGIQFIGSPVSGPDPLLAGDSAGVTAVAQTNWNALSGASFTDVGLHDNTGSSSGVTLTGGANGTYFSGPCTLTPGDEKLTAGELYNGWPGSPTFTLDNIPYAEYDIYFYATTDNNSRIETFGVSPGTVYDSTTASFESMQLMGGSSTWVEATSNWDGTGTAPTVAPGCYALFTDLTSADVSIAWGASGNGGLNGIQIVAVTSAIPEPSTWAMLAGGFGTLLAFRRRR